MPQIDSIRLACSLVSPLAHRARSAHSATHPLTVTAYITHRRRRLPFHGTAEREEEKEKGLSNLDTYVGYFANSMSNRSCHRIGLRPLSLSGIAARAVVARLLLAVWHVPTTNSTLPSFALFAECRRRDEGLHVRRAAFHYCLSRRSSETSLQASVWPSGRAHKNDKKRRKRKGRATAMACLIMPHSWFSAVVCANKS